MMLGRQEARFDLNVRCKPGQTHDAELGPAVLVYFPQNMSVEYAFRRLL